MVLIRYLALTLLVLLGGCAAHVTEAVPATTATLIDYGAEVRVSPDFAPAERTEIDAAFADWDRATGGSARFSLVPTPRHAPWTLVRAPVKVGLGDCDRVERRITLDGDAITPAGQPVFSEELRAVTLHELGHAMGLEHGDGELMDPHVGTCIDQASLVTLCALRPCAAMVPTCSGS